MHDHPARLIASFGAIQQIVGNGTNVAIKTEKNTNIRCIIIMQNKKQA